MRRFMLLGTAILMLSLACCNKVEFKEFSSPEGKFTILMPPNPEKKTQTVLGMTVVMYGKNVNNGAFAVGYADIPAGRPMSLPGAVQGIKPSGTSGAGSGRAGL